MLRNGSNELLRLVGRIFLGSGDETANDAGRKFLTKQFQAMGLTGVPSAANFLLLGVGRSGREMTEALLRRGVIVRPVGDYGFPTHLRITIGTAEENEKCVAALKA